MRYDDYSDKDRFLFLLTCSKRSLGSYFLAAFDADQKLKQDALLTIEEHIDRLARHRAWIILGQLVRDHGEEIVERLSSSPQELRPHDPQIRDSRPETRRLPDLRVHGDDALHGADRRRRDRPLLLGRRQRNAVHKP